jgi:hypothetical protein
VAFDLEPRDPLEPTQELPDAPLAEVITQLAEGVAEGQARLDLSAAQVASVLANSRVSVIPSVTQIVSEDGTTRYETASPVEVSLLELGITPTFYAFSEATAEVAMDLKVTESITETDTSEQRAFLTMGTRSLRMERRLNRDVTAHSRLSVKLVPVPTPVRLEPTTITVDEGEGQPTGGGAAVSLLSLSTSTVAGGTAASGTITLGAPAPAGGANVALSSANQDVVKVPAIVTVPAGDTTAQFEVGTEPISSSTPVSITASAEGVQRSTTLTVHPPAPSAFVFDPQQIGGGETSKGTIILSGPAPGDTSVALSGSNTDTAEFPATVPVEANATEVVFEAKGIKFTGADRNVTVSAIYLGGTQSSSLTVRGAAAPESLAVNPTSVVGRTGNVQGTITLSAPAPAGGTSVSLSSANQNVVKVPSSVSVPAGSTTAQFQVGTEPVSSLTPVAITASAEGVQKSVTLSVQPPAPSGFSFSPPQVAGGVTSTGTITLSGPAPSGTSIALSASNTSTATMPTSVAVPLNATQVTFNATGASFTGANQSVTVTVSYLGSTRQASLTVEGKPAPTLDGFLFEPEKIVGGEVSKGTITLSGPAPSGTSIALSASDTSAVSLPRSVPVPAGATEVGFEATGATFVGSGRIVTVKASYLGSTLSASLSVVGEDKDPKEVAIAKEIEVDSRTFEESATTAPEESAEKQPGEESTRESDDSASASSFVRPAESDLPGQEAVDQPPEQEEEQPEVKEEKPRARRGRKKKRPES